MTNTKFVSRVLELSETKNEKALPSEWDVVDMHNVPKYSNQIEKCLCGRPIAEVFEVQNQKNGNKTNVGSGCVNTFLNIPLDVFRAVQRIVIDPCDTIPKRILTWIREVRWINDDEFEFYKSLYGRKDLTDEEWAWKEDINTKIANCADEAKFCTQDIVSKLQQDKLNNDEPREYQPPRESSESPTVVLNDTIEEPVLERVDVEKLASLVLVNYACRIGWITPRQHNSYLLICRYAQKHNLDMRRQERIEGINKLINIRMFEYRSDLAKMAIQREFERRDKVVKALKVTQIATVKGDWKTYNVALKVFYGNIRKAELPEYIQPWLPSICDNLNIGVPV